MFVTDPRRPFHLDIRDLARGAGTMRELDINIAVQQDELAVGVVTIDAGTPVHVAGRLESALDGVLLTGTVTAVAVAECARCLDEVMTPVQGALRELFLYQPQDAEDDQFVVIDDRWLDLETPIRDALLLDLPTTPLCRPDCPGLCAQCGARLADEPGHGHEFVDSRWSGLVEAFQPNAEDLGGNPS